LAAEPVPFFLSQLRKQLARLLLAVSISVEVAPERMASVMVLERMSFMV
jgi:hypothetical protein